MRAWRNLTKYESRKEDLCEVWQTPTTRQILRLLPTVSAMSSGGLELLTIKIQQMTIQGSNIELALQPPLLIADVIGRFSENQSLTLIGEMKKLGVGLKILNNNKWERLSEYKLPFERFILLYNDDFKICDIGVY